MLPQKILKFRSSEMRPKWPPSLFNQPHGNSLGARLNFIMIPLKMVERSSISCDPSRYRNHVYICFMPIISRQESAIFYQINFISTEKWVGCKHFKSYIFEVFADKHDQVAGDSMTRSRRSFGGSRLLMKALHISDKCSYYNWIAICASMKGYPVYRQHSPLGSVTFFLKF